MESQLAARYSFEKESAKGFAFFGFADGSAQLSLNLHLEERQMLDACVSHEVQLLCVSREVSEVASADLKQRNVYSTPL